MLPPLLLAGGAPLRPGPGSLQVSCYYLLNESASLRLYSAASPAYISEMISFSLFISTLSSRLTSHPIMLFRSLSIFCFLLFRLSPPPPPPRIYVLCPSVLLWDSLNIQNKSHRIIRTQHPDLTSISVGLDLLQEMLLEAETENPGKTPRHPALISLWLYPSRLGIFATMYHLVLVKRCIFGNLTRK